MGAPGVEPDLVAYCKGIANGYPLAAVLGREAFRQAAAKAPCTGSFWASAVPMAAALATIKILLQSNACAAMEANGARLRTGLQTQAAKSDLRISCSGPPSMPLLTFEADREAAP